MENTKLAEPNLQYHRESFQPKTITMKIFNLAHFDHYCGGVQEWFNILDMPWSKLGKMTLHDI